MAIVMQMEWAGVTEEDYANVMRELDLDAIPPDGAVFHVAGVEGGSLRVVDVWESDGAWNDFLGNRLMPAIERAGLTGRGQPNVRTYEAYNVYAPDADRVGTLGASAAPA